MGMDKNPEQQENKMTSTTTTHTFQVGDVLVAGWGYDQTNIDYYEIVKTTPKFVTVQQLHTERVEDDDSTDFTTTAVKPVCGEYVNESVWNPERGYVQGDEPLQYRRKVRHLRVNGRDGVEAIDINSYTMARRWSGTPARQTKDQFGH